MGVPGWSNAILALRGHGSAHRRKDGRSAGWHGVEHCWGESLVMTFKGHGPVRTRTSPSRVGVDETAPFLSKPKA